MKDMDSALSVAQLPAVVDAVLAETQFIDMHTHLFQPALKGLMCWGIDELLTYHYCEAEFFRSAEMTPAEYFALSKAERADRIWTALFVENEPVSEATRGVIAVLQTFGLNPNTGDLRQAREFFSGRTLEQQIEACFRMAGISAAVMTNDPLDGEEAGMWKQGVAADARFPAVLRLDRVLEGWEQNYERLQQEGYAVDRSCGRHSSAELRRFLADWAKRMNPVYMAVSLPDNFDYTGDEFRSHLLREVILPACEELDLPLSLMIGVRRQVNPELRLAGDALGRADLRSLELLCLEYPRNRFLVSLLSRENQHELCVYARKFRNLLPFGCWWFLNNGSIVEEITRERLEMLGLSFIPQHSDARVLEQVVYKWRNTRRTLAPILSESYRLLMEDGRAVTRAAIERDVQRLFRGNFEQFVGRKI